MELVELPRQMKNRGFKGWPQVYRVGHEEEAPPVGVSFVRADEVDYPLVFRLMVPLLMKQHPYFNWREIYRELTGKRYTEQRVYQIQQVEGEGRGYSDSDTREERVSLEQLAADDATYVDLDILTEMAMVPAFLTDIRDAIKVNVTNNYRWQDGYDKKRGLCTGYLEETPRSRSLVILDISSSIPDGVSAGMMTLIKTITEVVHADLILTGGQSYFYTCEQVRKMDIRAERKRISRANESRMFREILLTHDMDYENVITFGDSDNPMPGVPIDQEINTKRWYSYFTMEHDTYGHSYKNGCGYGRWVKEHRPNVEIIHNIDWAKFFTRKNISGSW